MVTIKEMARQYVVYHKREALADRLYKMRDKEPVHVCFGYGARYCRIDAMIENIGVWIDSMHHDVWNREDEVNAYIDMQDMAEEVAREEAIEDAKPWKHMCKNDCGYCRIHHCCAVEESVN